jgi:hypothetical protein
MDSKYPVGTPEETITACEDFFQLAEQQMSNPDLSAEYCRGFFIAALRLREFLEMASSIESAKRAEALKKASDRIREERNGQPS